MKPEPIKIDPGNSLKLWEVVHNATVVNLLNQQVNFVQEQYHRDLLKYSVVDDGVKDVPRLLDSIRLPVFQDDLVKLRTGSHEEDTGDRLKTLEPFLSLSPLTTNINKEKRNPRTQFEIKT